MLEKYLWRSPITVYSFGRYFEIMLFNDQNS